MQHGELTQHIFEAQVGKGTNALLHRMPTGGWGRRWLSSTAECNNDIRAETGRGLDCDEYPFNSSAEGGPINYGAGRVSLKFIDPFQNRDGGRLLGGMYSADGLRPGERYLTIVNPASPLSFYLTRKGKLRMTRGPRED